MLEPDEAEEVEEFVRPLVYGGFTGRDDAVEATVEYFGDGYPEEELVAVVDRLWRERVAEQASWPEETETERVLAALDGLSTQGIVARSDFTCCNTCGAAEIGEEAADGDHGYVFFHRQDTESAALGGGLYLSYGTFDGTDATAVGHAVVAALTEAGAPTVWDGSARRRILVSPLEWRLRPA